MKQIPSGFFLTETVALLKLIVVLNCNICLFSSKYFPQRFSTRFFTSNTFIRNTKLKLTKNIKQKLSNTRKQCPEICPSSPENAPPPPGNCLPEKCSPKNCFASFFLMLALSYSCSVLGFL